MAKRWEGSSYQTIADMFSNGKVVAGSRGGASGGIFAFSGAMSAPFTVTFCLVLVSSPLLPTKGASGFLLFTGVWVLGATGTISSRALRIGSLGTIAGAAS